MSRSSEQPVRKVGIVGCGVIGGFLARQIVRRFQNSFELTAVAEIDSAKVRRLEKSLRRKIPCCSIPELADRVDLMIEAAGIDAAAQVLQAALKDRVAVLIVSIGVLLKYAHLYRTVVAHQLPLYIPSGAIAGLDGVKAARYGKITRVTLTTRKPVAGLAGAEYIRAHKINLQGLKREKIVFEGTAQQAIAGFPKNINVAAVLSLAGIGSRKTTVCIIADPKARRNSHTVEIEGDFGLIRTYAENVPSAENPRTSALAMLSVAASVGQIASSVRIGT